MNIELISQRCRLRYFSERDLSIFSHYRGVASVAKFQSWSSYSLEDAQHLYMTLTKTAFGEPGTWFQIAIADKQNDSLLGDCALHFLDDNRQVEIGFTLAPEHQGKGLAKEAVSLLLDYMFTVMDKHRVIALTDAENTPAKKLLRSLGFRQEAYFLKNVFFKGKWSDECLFSCLESEWKALRALQPSK
ncbi:MAG TPA: GNAT family protein [Gammaproteobacteria bacterium]|nr:GNAT family protein [Gammaproteobacteria bacterium]